jgi:hypothetical protein
MDPRQPPNDAKPLTEAQFLAEAPLLINLQRRMECARSLQEWAIARVQWALYLARTHRIDEAATVPDEIRSRFRGREDGEVFFWTWMLEGVIKFYRSGTTQGMPWLRRAWAVSKSFNYPVLQEYMAAWAAHFCFTDGRYEEMIEWLGVARFGKSTLPEAACRVALVTAGAWQACDEGAIAVKWYSHARDIARSIGDRASIMASMENRAFLRLDRLWVRGVRDSPPIRVLSEIENELVSGLMYERITCSESLIAQGPVARLRVMVLRGQLESALNMIEQLPPDFMSSGFSIVRATAILRIWLMSELNLIGSLDLLEVEKLKADVCRLDWDDALVCYGMLADLAERFLDSRSVLEFRQRLDECVEKYEYEMKSLSDALRSVPEIVVPPLMVRTART